MQMDLPQMPGNELGVVVVREAGKLSQAPLIAKQVARSAQRVAGVCFAVEANIHPEQDSRTMLSSAVSAASYLFRYEKRQVLEPSDRKAETLVESPSHGRIVIGENEDGSSWYEYVPDRGYVGPERFAFDVAIAGTTVRVVYLLKIAEQVGERRGDNSSKDLCKKLFWKISYDPSTANAPLSALLPRALQSLTGFADLSGSSVGETVGTGSEAQITLDTTAAGHAWYIDYTPYLNEEYLPTSNPNEWVAKEGSEAAGKMDLLSVLLHEYGHALGLEHSDTGHDLMSPTLAPGVRRLPSQEELALMARLVGEVKAGIEGSEGIAGQSGGGNTPAPSPIDTLIGRLRNARIRRTGYGGLSLEGDGLQSVSAAPTPRAQQTLNPSLGHTPADWQTAGNVAIDAAGTLTLQESATAQTRAHQAFLLGPNDRYLSFTVADLALEDVDNGPDDAFEVALLDANSGASLLGGIGLGNSDALLNRQADGRERLASGVTRSLNADGSRSYLIDLTHLPAGTAAHLSFDLIGFAGTGSHATVRDLRLLGAPEAHDDRATGREDTPVVLDLVANDLGALQPGSSTTLRTGSVSAARQ